MNEIIERVVLAVEGVGDPAGQDFDAWKIAVARAAIAAMRDPTEAMKQSLYGATVTLNHGESLLAWHTMIDEALKDG